MSRHGTTTARQKQRAKLLRQTNVIAGVVTIALFDPFDASSITLAATLPVPCAGNSCVSVAGPQTWVTSGKASLVQVGGQMTITQSTENAVLNWQSFNISSDGTVTFKQPDSTAVALNKIFQADPSKILGALNANGSVYLINQNGIIFGAGAQVNTGSLIASTLNITPDALSGILNAGVKGGPAFANVDDNNNPLTSQAGNVQVAAGAKITSPGGEIMLFGSNVTNQGALSAPGGQVILAAGDSVYLAASSDPNLRGLLVEVGKGGTVTNADASSPGGADYGQIAATDGNVTMTGLIVNQLGRVSATTAVQQNGSIYLMAQDGGSATAPASTSLPATLNAADTGTLTLGPHSHTDVTLDLASTSTEVDATLQPKSQVVLSGKTVWLQGGSEITATSGNVAVFADASPVITGQNSVAPPALPKTDDYASQPGDGRLEVDAGATIDVSGANVTLPMSSNVIPVQLRGVELADSPLQRSGPLYGQTVYIDTRQSGTLNGTAWEGSPIGNLSGYVEAVPRTVAQRNLTGGTISLNSDGAVLVASQAALNISGGSTNFQAGYINTTKLLGTNGQVYDISQANPNQTYVGIVTNYSVTDPKWGITQNYPGISVAAPQGQYQAGYVQGADAGAVQIVSPRLVLDGNVTANTVVGPYQRQLPAALNTTDNNPNLFRPVNQMPLSGELILGRSDGGTLGNDYILPDVTFTSGTVLDKLTGPNGAPFNPLTDPLPDALDTIYIRPDLLGSNGVGRLEVFANGTVSVPYGTSLLLPIDGQLTMKAGAIDFAGSVTANDGSVTLSATQTATIQGGVGPSTLTLGARSLIDVSGEWINDQPALNVAPGTAPLAVGGGTVKISTSGGTPLDLQAGSTIDVSGGAQRNAQGTITGGAAGSITISVGSSPNPSSPDVPVTVASTLEGFGLNKGGTLSLTANAVCIAATNCAANQTGTLWVAPELFSADGFANINVASDTTGLDVLAGTQVVAQQSNFIVRGDLSSVPTGTPFSQLATIGLLPDLVRAPVNVSLDVAPTAPPGVPGFTDATYATAGILGIDSGATISLDPDVAGGKLTLTSDSSIVIDGGLSAPAGTLAISTTTNLALNGFPTAQGIWLENDASLSTQGLAQLQTNDFGQRTGSVAAGGSISITANRGYLITDPGSSINASGTAATIDLAGGVGINGTLASSRTLIGSNGGTISLTAAEGMLLNGAVTARAGNAPGAAGGTLDITFDGNLHGLIPTGSVTTFPLNPHQIILSDGAPIIVAPQGAIPSQYNGIAEVPTAMIEAGGFSSLQLTATNLIDSSGTGQPVPTATGSIVFPKNTTLTLPASIRLDAPEIVTTTGAQVNLQAAYVGLGYNDPGAAGQLGASTNMGTNSGSFTVNADLVDFIGTLGLGGFSSSTINSTGDIRFIGVQSPPLVSGGPPAAIAGALYAEGNLVLQADQVYPTTLTEYWVQVAGAPNNEINNLEILPGTTTPGAVLSAGGKLVLEADTIEQAGILRAPFGQLVLGYSDQSPLTSDINASVAQNPPSTAGTYQVNLEPGSTTSTSGAGLTIPFGNTQAGTDWVYDLPGGQFSVYTQSGPPSKSVQLSGNSLVVAKGATIDISGGGDLQASEFLPGVGGSTDVLSNSYSAASGQFAIVPTLSLQFAPYDPQLQSGFKYAPGSSVVLSGGGGVAAGTYAILPAAYALLPGAYLVKPVSGFTDIAPGASIAQPDGSTIVAGQFAVAGTNFVSGRTQGFDLVSAKGVQSLAQYQLTSANTFFAQQAKANGVDASQLPMDAGQLQFTAGQQLQFLGALTSTPAQGGRGGEVDISASELEITNGGSATTGPGSVVLQAAQLNSLGAQSVLIGGTRSQDDGVNQITTKASSVVVDQGVTLSGSEIMLTASTDVTVSGGATLNANGTAGAGPSSYQINGDGALLRVSTGAQTAIVRNDAAPNPAMGALTIDQGATLQATGSATLEASGNLQSQANYDLPGASLSFTATEIALGTPSSGSSSGVVLSGQQLSSLNLSALELTSRSSIDIYGANTLSVGGTLNLNAPTIQSGSSDASALLQANQIILGPLPASKTSSAITDPASTGSLTLQADHLVLGGGTTQFSGFNGGVNLNGAADIHATAAGSITSDAPVTLHTGLLSSADGVDFSISSAGALQVLSAVAPSQSAATAAGAGGKISLTGTSVEVGTAVALPSGILQLAANGPSASDNITLDAGAAIDVSGRSTSFDSVVVAAPGGLVSMSTANGNVTMASGAQINLSAASGGSGAAGALSISAPSGTADLQGTLTATGGAGSSAGQFTLDVAQLPDLAALNSTLNTGGFAGLRSFTQHGTGDVTLASNGVIRANDVSITNDGGSVNILGSIDASGATGGTVSLAAQNVIDVAGSINASASGSAQTGGTLNLTSTNGIIHIDSGANVNLSGGSGGAGGNLDLTVPYNQLTALVTPGAGSAAVTLGGNIQGVQQVQVEGLHVYDAANDSTANTISAADISNWYNDAATFMSNASAISGALQGSSHLNVVVVPGIEVESSTDLTLATNWDLSGYGGASPNFHFNGASGVLTLRAAGNLLIDQSLSDGFNGVTGAGAFLLPTAPYQSWSYRLVAGADLGSSNLMAVAGSTGNIELAAGTVDAGTRAPAPIMVRTGTGSIDIAAAGDLEFGVSPITGQAGTNRASVIYTAGENSGAGVALPELSNLAYPTGGGNININVGGDILGAPTNQLVTSWLWRAGQAPGVLNPAGASATGWTVNYQWFEENIGALGGGNVSINAGGNISQLSVAIPTIGRQVDSTAYGQSVVQVTGGGNLNVQSGSNITGGSYFVARGAGALQAWGSIGADTSGAANTTSFAPVLALGNATMDVDARTGVTLEGVVNPFLLPQGKPQIAILRGGQQSVFSTYTDTSAVSVVSTAGDVTLLNQESTDGLQPYLSSMTFSGALATTALIYPGTVNATALTGNLNIDDEMVLWPSPTGNLDLFAGQNVIFPSNGGNTGILMSGVDPGTLASPTAPLQPGPALTAQLTSLFTAPAAGVSYTPIHVGDPNPVRVVALDGDVTDAQLIYIPKPIDIIAGQDITDLNVRVDNLASTDISIISAGQDITYTSPRDANGKLIENPYGILVEGPGSLLVEAGGNINLGTSAGIQTIGNQSDPLLPSGGASVNVLTGATTAKADLADFITTYLSDSSLYDSLLLSYVQARTTDTVTTKADALSIFKSFSQQQQYLLCEQIFYDEIRAGGRAAAAPGPGHNDYTRSFTALSTLFPNSTTASGPNAATTLYPGSLSLYFSQIYTKDGGDISLVTPGGSVDVGLAAPPAAFGIQKQPSDLGIVAQTVGNVSSVSYGNFLVNQSRVFAAGGGDILVWSTDGNVDAGRGAKTALSASNPVVTINQNGQLQETFPATLTGSGIQALATIAGSTPGDVDLYAPQGVVNASDAGIVAGNLTIGATAVLGRNNITVSGTFVAPPVEATGLGATYASSSSVSSSSSSVATSSFETGNQTSAAPLADTALSWLDVFVIGLGEENCKPEDTECLKSQKPAQ